MDKLVVIEVNGGMITAIWSGAENEKIRFVILDYDAEDMDVSRRLDKAEVKLNDMVESEQLVEMLVEYEEGFID